MPYTTVIDGVASVIGYTNTRVLIAWYAGRKLHVPTRDDPEHPLVTLIGLRTFRRLVAEYGGNGIDVPTLAIDDAIFRDRKIAEMLAAGETLATVAASVGLSERRTEQIRDELLVQGWLRFAEGFRRPSRGRGAVVWDLETPKI